VTVIETKCTICGCTIYANPGEVAWCQGCNQTRVTYTDRYPVRVDARLLGANVRVVKMGARW
jgi:hypothetical protein